MFYNKAIAAILLTFSSVCYSSVTSTYSGKITGIRVEGSTGLISMEKYIEDGEPRCNRVWVDLLEDADKAAYSTFLMAFASDKTVHIRARPENNKRYSACDFYDVYIPQQ